MDTVFKALVDYGFSTVFIGGLFVFFYALGRRILKLIDIWLGKIGKKTPKMLDELSKEETKIDSEINNILYEILDEFCPDRIMVLQYHNGTYYNSGQHMKFISCTHEQPNVGVRPGSMEFQRIPSAIFQPANSSLLEGKNIIDIPDVEREGEELSKRELLLKEVYKNLGFKSYYAFALRTHQGHLIGKVTLVGIHRKINFTDEQLSKIYSKCGRIESLLNINIK